VSHELAMVTFEAAVMRWVLILSATAAITTAGGYIAGPATHALAHLAAREDPVARADLLVQDALTPQRLASELDKAIKAEDPDLADSLIELASDRQIFIDPQQLQHITDLKSHAGSRGLRDFAEGFVTGGRESGAALSGALTADVTGFGDMRDLVLEGRKVLAGGSPDHLTVGLAAAGLALSVATWSTIGAAMPARSGVSLVKAVQKSGRLSKPLSATLARTASTALDQDALKLAVAAAGRFELSAARQAAGQVLRPAAMAEFRQVGDSVATVYARTGQRGTREMLALAQSPAELRQAARIASAKGTKSRGIFALLGRGALMAGSLGLTLAGWLVTLVVWLFGAALWSRKMGLMLGRWIWPRRERSAKAGRIGTSTSAPHRTAVGHVKPA
jgi:hypothetical protein